MARILVAEHNETTVEYLKKALGGSENTLVFAKNALEAWRASSQDVFDVFLVDVAMPSVDGFILAQKALQENPYLKIIFITGFSAVLMDTSVAAVYANTSVVSYPFHLKEVSSCIRFLMGEGQFPLPDLSGVNSSVVYHDFNAREASF